MKVLNDLQLPAKLRGALRAAPDRIAAEFGWIGWSPTEPFILSSGSRTRRGVRVMNRRKSYGTTP
jgi:hypothetical protein